MGETALDVLVLGATEVRAGAVVMRVDRPLERALLVRLALARGTPVADDRLAADLWGDQDLQRPTQRLRVVASRLRTALGERGHAVTRAPGGYRVAATPADLLDAQAAADRLHAAARAGDPRAVRDAAASALAAWRGPALADLRSVPFARTEAERLDSWQVDLTVHRISAELELGTAAELLAELTSLAAEHPLHEPIHRLLAHALYRTGRQADALEQLGRLRRTLADQLGVDPTPDTAALELRLLRQDPTLLATRAERPSAPTPAVLTAVPAHLPNPTTSFVGRDGELAALLSRVSVPGVVTLVGGPGSGKSRLAIEAAKAAANAGRQVTVVELAPVRDQEAMLAAIADAVGVEAGAGDPLQVAAEQLSGGLLVLDNAEHLVEEVSATVRGLRGAATDLSVLVTSQRALLLAEETQHRVGPLPRSAAAALFVERARPDALGGPREGSTDESDIEIVCAAVDGLPLGIELAAGLTRTLTVAQLARRVTDRLRLLVGGGRDSGGRHTSLRAALDWSHELLDVHQQAVLRRLGAFAGGFDLEAAEAVTAGGKVEVGDVAPALAGLVDRSLVGVVTVAGERRFTLLETVRAYAVEQLTASGDLMTAQAAHLSWCLARVRHIGAADGFTTAESVSAVFAEWPNLVEALERAPGTDRAAEALALANELHTPWLAQGRFRTARHHFAALADAAGAEPAVRALALSNRGFHALMAGLPDEAIAMLTAAAELAADAGNDTLTLNIRYHQGVLSVQLGLLAEAITTLRAGRELAHALGVPREAAFAGAMGTALQFSGRTHEAIAAYEESIAIDRELGDVHGLSRGFTNLASALLDAGRLDDALEAAAESDLHAHALEDRQVLPLNELVRSAVALRTGRLADAETHARAATAFSEEGASMAHIDLAWVLVERGAYTEAADLLTAVYAATSPTELAWMAAKPVSAALALALDDRAAARTLVDEITAAHAAVGFGWPRYTDLLERVRRELDPPANG